MAKAYVSTRKNTVYVEDRSYSVLFVIAAVVVFIVAGFFVMNAHRGLNEDLIMVLENQRQTQEINMELKTELAGITQTRFMELKANERLGLKRPKEEEVLVLR
jgi:hypothetical protein